jgi:hypothetical protein
MAKKKRHSRVEIATKLAQANGLATQGKLQSEIARELQLENSRLKRLVTYAELEMLFPSVPWRDPIRISDLDGNFGFACRFCIARHGIRGCDISMSAREVRRHIGVHHPWSVGHERIRRKRIRRKRLRR